MEPAVTTRCGSDIALAIFFHRLANGNPSRGTLGCSNMCAENSAPSHRAQQQIMKRVKENEGQAGVGGNKPGGDSACRPPPALRGCDSRNLEGLLFQEGILVPGREVLWGDRAGTLLVLNPGKQGLDSVLEDRTLELLLGGMVALTGPGLSPRANSFNMRKMQKAPQ